MSERRRCRGVVEAVDEGGDLRRAVGVVDASAGEHVQPAGERRRRRAADHEHLDAAAIGVANEHHRGRRTQRDRRQPLRSAPLPCGVGTRARPPGDEHERRADDRGEHDGDQLPAVRQRGAHPALEALHRVGDRGRVLADVDDGEVVEQVDARQHEEGGGDEVDVAHRRAQRPEEQLVGAGQADGEGDDDEPHPGAVEHGVGDAGGEPSRRPVPNTVTRNSGIVQPSDATA